MPPVLRYSLALAAVVAAGLTLGGLLWAPEEAGPAAAGVAAERAVDDDAAPSCSSCTLRHQRLSRDPDQAATASD